MSESREKVVILAAIISSYPFTVFAFQWVWNTFLPPLGVWPVSYFHAVGILLLVGFVRPASNSELEWSTVAAAWAFPLITMLIGYVARGLM